MLISGAAPASAGFVVGSNAIQDMKAKPDNALIAVRTIFC
jgi:hypothetical protein